MSSLARPARTAFNLVAWLFVGCVGVQIYLAGLGVFDRPDAFLTHREFGYLFGILTLFLVVLALVGRMPRWVIGGSALLMAMFALQSVFIALRTDMPSIAALHPVNGFMIMLVATIVAWKTRAYLRPAESA